MFEERIERKVLYKRNFRTFSGLFTISNQFRARTGFGLVFSGSSRVWARSIVGHFTALARFTLNYSIFLKYDLSKEGYEPLSF